MMMQIKRLQRVCRTITGGEPTPAGSAHAGAVVCAPAPTAGPGRARAHRWLFLVRANRGGG